MYYSCWHAGAYTVEPVNMVTSGSKKPLDSPFQIYVVIYEFE